MDVSSAAGSLRPSCRCTKLIAALRQRLSSVRPEVRRSMLAVMHSSSGLLPWQDRPPGVPARLLSYSMAVPMQRLPPLAAAVWLPPPPLQPPLRLLPLLRCSRLCWTLPAAATAPAVLLTFRLATLSARLSLPTFSSSMRRFS